MVIYIITQFFVLQERAKPTKTEEKDCARCWLTYNNNCSGGENVNDKALNIKIPSALYEALKKEAAKKNISLASLVRLICSEYFEKK